MNRREFMERLEELLKDLPVEDRADAISYYAGYFADAGVENEQKVIQELESPEKVAANIKADIFGEQQTLTEKKEDNTGRIILFVVIAVVTSPVWLGILGGVFGGMIGISVAAFGLLVAAIAIIGCAIASGMAGTVAITVALIGAGFIVAAIGILLMLLCVWLWGKALPAVVQWLFNTCKKLISGKEQNV